MRSLVATFFTCIIFVSNAGAQTLACQPVDGVFVQSGQSVLSKVDSYDAMILKNRFFVEKSTANVVGGALFSTDGKRRDIVRNDANVLEVSLRNSLGDTSVLKVIRSNERWSFTHYSSWLNLLLVGACEPT